MMGQETFQIVGDVVEMDTDKVVINNDDIETIIKQTNCSREEALDALEESSGNLAKAILRLQNK